MRLAKVGLALLAIGGRHDRTERLRSRPGQSRDRCVRDQGDRGHRHEGQRNRVERYPARFTTEVVEGAGR